MSKGLIVAIQLAGTATLLRTYIMGATTMAETSDGAASVTMCQSLGYSVGPGW